MRRRRNKLRARYGGGSRPLDLAIAAVDEPQHGAHLEAIREHGQEWAQCNRCGRQWAIDGDQAEVVTAGNGVCDDEALRNPVRSRPLNIKRS